MRSVCDHRAHVDFPLSVFSAHNVRKATNRRRPTITQSIEIIVVNRTRFHVLFTYPYGFRADRITSSRNGTFGPRSRSALRFDEWLPGFETSWFSARPTDHIPSQGFSVRNVLRPKTIFFFISPVRTITTPRRYTAQTCTHRTVRVCERGINFVFMDMTVAAAIVIMLQCYLHATFPFFFFFTSTTERSECCASGISGSSGFERDRYERNEKPSGNLCSGDRKYEFFVRASSPYRRQGNSSDPDNTARSPVRRCFFFVEKLADPIRSKHFFLRPRSSHLA